MELEKVEFGKMVPDRYLKFGLASWRGRPRRHESFHRHDEIEVLLLESGGLAFLFGPGRVDLKPGAFGVFWGAMPHKMIYIHPASRYHWMTLPLAWFLEWGLPAPFVSSVLAGEVLLEPDASRASADRARFEEWHADLESGNAERRKAVLLEVEARLRRLAVRHGRPRTVGAKSFGKEARGLDRSGLGRVEKMAAFIAATYREPIGVAEIAAAAGLHPDYATALFRRTTGSTLVEYVTEHRVSHAQRLLSTTDRKVLDIALDAGFGSLSRFYEAFTRTCGRTPRAFRRAMRRDG